MTKKEEFMSYKCPYEPSKPKCMFHDGSSFRDRADYVRNEYYNMVEEP